MGMTPAQKKATAEAREKLRQAEKTLGKEAGAIRQRIRTGGRTSVIPSKVTEITPGVYRYIDPITGRASITTSKADAERYAMGGAIELTKEFQEKYRDTGRIRLIEELARRGDVSAIEELKQIKKSPFQIPTRQEQIIAERTAPTISSAQQRYIASLRSGITPTIEAYRGVGFDVRAKDITWQEPVFGTITPDTTTGFRERSVFEELKLREVIDPDISIPVEVLYQQQADRIANKIIEEETTKAQAVLQNSLDKIQAKIDSGEMSVMRGNEALDRITDTANRKLQSNIIIKFDKQLTAAQKSKAFKDKLSKATGFREAYKFVDPEFIKERTKRKIKTAIDITAAVVSGVAPPVGIAYFGAKGLYLGTKKPTRKEALADIGAAWQQSLKGKEVTESELLQKYKGYRREAGVSLLFAGMSGITYAGQIGGQITTGRAAALKAKPWTITGREIGKDKGVTVLKVSASKTTGVASAEAELILPIQMDAKGGYKILAGKGSVKTRVVDFMRQGVVKPGEDVIKGSLKFTTFGKGTTREGFFRTDFGNIKLDKLGIKVTAGEGYISPNTVQNIRTEAVTRRRWISKKPFDVGTKQEWLTRFDVATKPEHFKFGGISRETPTGTQFISGKLSRARLYPAEGRFTGLFKIGAKGEIIKKGAVEEAAKGWRTFTGGGTKSSKAFFEQLYAPKVVPKVITKAEVAAKQITPGILGAAEKGVITTTKIAPSVFARTALSTLPVVGAKAAPVITPLIDIKSTGRLKDKYGVAPGVDVGITGRSISEGLDVNPITGVKPSTDVFFRPASAVSPRLSTRQAARQIVKPVQAPGVIPPISTPTPRDIPTPIPSISPPIFFGFEKKKKPQVVKAQGFDAFYLRHGTKPVAQRSWVKINKKPLTKKSALSMMGRTVDERISARGKIEKTPIKKGKPKVGLVLDTKDKYWQRSSKRFRPWKQKKGVRTPLGQDRYIERQKFRISSPQEKASLRSARGVAGFLGGVRNQPTPNLRTKKGVFRL